MTITHIFFDLAQSEPLDETIAVRTLRYAGAQRLVADLAALGIPIGERGDR